MQISLTSDITRGTIRLDLPRSDVPHEEDLGMLMSSVVIYVHMCRREGEKKGGLSRKTKNGVVDSEHGVSKSKSSQLRTKSHHSM
jgi:hypothetical protein